MGIWLRLDTLTVVKIYSGFYWIMTPCSLVGREYVQASEEALVATD